MRMNRGYLTICVKLSFPPCLRLRLRLHLDLHLRHRAIHRHNLRSGRRSRSRASRSNRPSQTTIPMMTGTYTRLGVDKVFEMVVVEANFQFWQYTPPGDTTVGCSAIPPATATPAQMWSFLSYHGTPQQLASDQALAAYEPYYFQAQRELGAPAPFEAPIASLQMFPGLDVSSTYLPPGNIPTYDPNAMPDVTAWLQSQSERMMFIYGEYDVNEFLTVRAGRWLSPYGIWNIDHGSPAIIGVSRPYVVGAQLIASEQARENMVDCARFPEAARSAPTPGEVKFTAPAGKKKRVIPFRP